MVNSFVIRVGGGIFILFLLTATAFAQQAGSIRGVIYDEDFNAPLALAQVMISETGQKATATEQGNYVIEGVAPGSYTLVFSKEGYARQVKTNVVVQSGQLTDADASLTGEFAEMEEFVVQDVRIGGGTEKALDILRAESPAIISGISAEILSKSGASNAADALKLISGTTVQEGKFAVIRGLPDRYVNTQLNGVRLPSADDTTRAVELDQFSSAVIDSVQVSKTFTPDQQGDASGGAVNVVLKGIPDQTILQFSSSVGYNTNAGGRKDFLSYKGGGLTYWGFNQDNNRQVQDEWFTPAGGGGIYDGAVGSSTIDAPIDYKWGVTAGSSFEVDEGVKLGGLISFNYERDSSMYDNGIDDEYVLDRPTHQLIPKKSLVNGSDFRTSLYDVTQSSQEVKWNALGTIGLETEHHKLKMTYLYTRAAEDTVTLANDTRGKQYFFPGYDPNGDPFAPGGPLDAPYQAPYRRNETLSYSERSTQSIQFSGDHTLPVFDAESDTWITLLNPEFDWTFALNNASFLEPDKRLFSTMWVPGISEDFFPGLPPDFYVGSWQGQAPGNNINLGFLQRIFREITEDSTQYQLNLKFPFRQWTDTKGYIKFGVFNDKTNRKYNQESFGNFGDNSTFSGNFDDSWGEAFPDEVHNVTPSLYDADYTGEFNVDAWYWMVDLPIVETFRLIGGIRYENTQVITKVQPDIAPNGDTFVVFYPPGSQTPVKFTPDKVNVNYEQEDVLPAISFVWDIMDTLTLRGSYAETVARQTFRELTPIQQQEYLGGDVFVGNPSLSMSSLKNYDLRLDYKPTAGSLFSVSYFFKDIKNPIEYVQFATSDAGTFTTPVNYSSGEISGWEFEVRQDMGFIWEDLAGLSIGGNATLIDSQVTIPDAEVQHNIDQGGPADRTRNATNAPSLLYNVYLTYLVEPTNTEFSVFYTVRGDTLVSGAGVGDKGYIPDVYETEYGTLNVGITQSIGEHIKLKFQAKNLLDPEIQTVYRYNGNDTAKSSYTKGIDFSIGISAEFKF